MTPKAAQEEQVQSSGYGKDEFVKMGQ